MRSLCSLNVLITIRDFSILMVKDIDAALLALAKETYDRRCYQLKFVHSVNKILYRSNIEANHFDPQCSFNVNMIVEADCDHYAYQEAIMDMTVIKKGDAVGLRKDNAIALLRLIDGIDVVEGNTYPIRVSRATMDIGNGIVKITAEPFKPAPFGILLQLTGHDKHDEVLSLRIAINAYQNVLQHISTYDNKVLAKTCTALYPFAKKQQAISGHNMSLLELAEKCAQGGKIDGTTLYSGDRAEAENRLQGLSVVVDHSTDVADVISPARGIEKALMVEARWLMEIANAIDSKLIENTQVMSLYAKYRK